MFSFRFFFLLLLTKTVDLWVSFRVNPWLVRWLINDVLVNCRVSRWSLAIEFVRRDKVEWLSFFRVRFASWILLGRWSRIRSNAHFFGWSSCRYVIDEGNSKSFRLATSTSCAGRSTEINRRCKFSFSFEFLFEVCRICRNWMKNTHEFWQLVILRPLKTSSDSVTKLCRSNSKKREFSRFLFLLHSGTNV